MLVAQQLIDEGRSKAAACKLSGLPRRSLYYSAKKRSYASDENLGREILKLCRERPLYGYRRVTAMLHRKGHVANRKKVLRLMRQMDLLHTKPLHRPHWQTSKGSQIVSTPDTYWQTDMTKIWCGADGWGYLFNVIDCCSRSWLGYCFSKFCSTDESLAALQTALAFRAPQTMAIVGLRIGTDGGSQYTSKKFEKAIGLLGIVHEVSRRHTPEDDGVVESFHKTLKAEYVWPYEFTSFAQAQEVMGEAFHDYNYCRIHSGINYKTPNEYLVEVTGKAIISFQALKSVQR